MIISMKENRTVAPRAPARTSCSGWRHGLSVICICLKLSYQTPPSHRCVWWWLITRLECTKTPHESKPGKGERERKRKAECDRSILTFMMEGMVDWMTSRGGEKLEVMKYKCLFVCEAGRQASAERNERREWIPIPDHWQARSSNSRSLRAVMSSPAASQPSMQANSGSRHLMPREHPMIMSDVCLITIYITVYYHIREVFHCKDWQASHQLLTV